ncbi:hypothetical protein [Mesonia sp. HuA40]|uniref:hypothetical protein n=1 Tax=Mesonia sp. HuA40 TaxID=2602761 RepID=UPI0011CC4B4B|nr:hypothetical protein [Mesonia sp. HuA40]TXK73923.1 hypothetical protein FT993_03430 [Mesonia sp. HuA40]
MSQLTANSVMPIVSSLPKEEKALLLQRLKEMIGAAPKAKKKRKSVYDNVDPIFWPENHEMLVAEIMNN